VNGQFFTGFLKKLKKRYIPQVFIISQIIAKQWLATIFKPSHSGAVANSAHPGLKTTKTIQTITLKIPKITNKNNTNNNNNNIRNSYPGHLPAQLLMVKPLGVHSREETVVVFVYEVEVEVVVFQYMRNLPSLS
jgi:hypothetical protein